MRVDADRVIRRFQQHIKVSVFLCDQILLFKFQIR